MQGHNSRSHLHRDSLWFRVSSADGPGLLDSLSDEHFELLDLDDDEPESEEVLEQEDEDTRLGITGGRNFCIFRIEKVGSVPIRIIYKISFITLFGCQRLI